MSEQAAGYLILFIVIGIPALLFLAALWFFLCVASGPTVGTITFIVILIVSPILAKVLE